MSAPNTGAASFSPVPTVNTAIGRATGAAPISPATSSQSRSGVLTRERRSQ